jgi:hypothetical protein
MAHRFLPLLPPADQTAVRAVAAVLLAWAMPLTALAGDGPRMPRVRANNDPTIAAFLEEGAERSPTFRGLTEQIDTTNGLVYVERGTCGRHVRACLVHKVTVAGSNRILRIVVDTQRDHAELIAAIGHELQHAVEALSDPFVTSDSAMYWCFDRIAPRDKGKFETDAAIQIGVAVWAELRTPVRRSNTKVAGPARPRRP